MMKNTLIHNVKRFKVALAGAGSLAAVTVSAQDTPAELQTELTAAALPMVGALRQGSEYTMSVFEQPGDFVLTLTDGHELGLYVDRQRWPLAEAPYFLFRVKKGDDPFDYDQAVLTPDGDGWRLESIPADWLVTTYSDERQPQREPSLPAGNLPRRIDAVSPTHYRLDSGFIESLTLMQNATNRVHLVITAAPAQVIRLNVGVNRARDAAEAAALAEAAAAALLP